VVLPREIEIFVFAESIFVLSAAAQEGKDPTILSTDLPQEVVYVKEFSVDGLDVLVFRASGERAMTRIDDLEHDRLHHAFLGDFRNTDSFFKDFLEFSVGSIRRTIFMIIAQDLILAHGVFL